jgi:DNA-binding NarL/FixJ family response regulator
MKRPIFVRHLSDAERDTLEAGLRSPDAFTLRRCQILLASDRGENAYQIAHELGCNSSRGAARSWKLRARGFGF